MLRREDFDAVYREEELKTHRLLRPKTAVVVEGGDAFGRWHEVRRALLGHLLDKGDDCLLGLAFVPRRNRIGDTGVIDPSQAGNKGGV